MPQPIFRFAPSPNGRLHLGHAYSALLNQRLAREAGGKFLLRIEDTDLERCTPVLEQRMLEDLHWLGIKWDGEPLRQSDDLAAYNEVIDTLAEEGLVYPSFMSRSEVRQIIATAEASGENWPRDPDGAPFYPSHDRLLDANERNARIDSGEPHALRLDMTKAIELAGEYPDWQEEGAGPKGETGLVTAKPQDWGDIILSRKDAPASYHLASVVDDALQGVTHIVRGRDLFWSTSVHRLLQELLGFAVPYYFHHDLVLDDTGRKLSKSQNDTAIAELRAAGTSPADIRKMVGL